MADRVYTEGFPERWSMVHRDDCTLLVRIADTGIFVLPSQAICMAPKLAQGEAWLVTAREIAHAMAGSHRRELDRVFAEFCDSCGIGPPHDDKDQPRLNARAVMTWTCDRCDHVNARPKAEEAPAPQSRADTPPRRPTMNNPVAKNGPVGYTTLAELAQVRSGYYGRMQDDANEFGWEIPLYSASTVEALQQSLASTEWMLEQDRALLASVTAENAALLSLIRWAHDTLWELNPSNYDHDDVCKVNDASVEVILGLAPALGETHGKPPEWWEARAALQEKSHD